MDVQPSAPPVVAVVVAAQQGPWFEEALAALGAQDYPNQPVLVVDAAGAGTRGGSAIAAAAPDECAARVAAVLPEAYLRRIEGKATFAAMANDALSTVQGSSFLLFCHDDVAPDADAVRLMVEEALRSNAGIVGPKIVNWDDPTKLLDVGLAVDKTGAAEPLADRGELDQEQHDAVKDVFAVSWACMLVRSDLFVALGGFDPVMGDHGADIDLCWRAQVAGARVMVAPAARVRHLEGGAEAPPAPPETVRMEARNRLRAMLKSYSFLHLVRVIPQAAVVAVVEAIVAIATRHRGEASALLSAWWWNGRRLREVWRLRKQVAQHRAVPDSEVRRLQVRGSVRASSFVRHRLHPEDRARALLEAGHHLAGAVEKGPARVAAVVLCALVLALLVGSRYLITSPLPAVGEFAPFPGVGNLLSQFVHGWRTTGMGSVSAVPPAFGLLGIGGALLFGQVDLLQKILVLGTIPIGGFGAWHLANRLGSTLGRLVLTIAYLAIPLPYNAIAGGRWSGLIAYAAAPWILGRLGYLCRVLPFVSEWEADERPTQKRERLELVVFGLALAPIIAFVPSLGIAILLAGAGILIGSLLVGESASAARGLVATAIALVVALVLLLPWTLELLVPGKSWSTLVGVAQSPERAAGLGALLRFEVGPLGAAPLGWAILLAATLPLVVGQGWRFAWAVRFWVVALLCVLVVWAGGRGWIPLRLQSPDVVLAMAAIALAAAAALGATAYELDIRAYRFGWRQVAFLASGFALILGTLPLLGAASDGRWNLTPRDVARSVSWMTADAGQGAFRVLWVGDPNALPLAGWPLSEGTAYATSRNGPPVATDNLPGPASDATLEIGNALDQSTAGDTSRLGRLLAPMAVRYVVLPSALATGDSGRKNAELAPPAALSQGLASQLDLRLLPSDPSTVVYENTAWGPGRQVVPERLTAGSPLPEELGRGADLSGAAPVLRGRGPVEFKGRIDTPGQVLISEAPSSRWKLRTGSDNAPRQPAFGVANAYTVERPGNAIATFQTPLLRYGALLVEAALWALAIRAAFQLRRLRSQPQDRYHDGPDHPVPPARIEAVR